MNGTDELKDIYVVHEFEVDYDYYAAFQLAVSKAGVNGKNKPKDDHGVCEFGCDYAVDNDSGEFFLLNGGLRPEKCFMACH